MNRLALFDCDGTLVDSQANICAAMEASFAAHGLAPPPRAATRRVVGLSLVEAVRLLHPSGADVQHRALAEDYKTAFQQLRHRGEVAEPLFDGIAGAIAALQAAGWVLGVATGKSDRGLRLCLEHHGLIACFTTLQTADRHPSKPHPSMARQALAEALADPAASAMIGDTSFDMAMAKAVGMFAIGVAWGYHDADELVAAGADRIAESPHELATLLERLA